MLLARRISRIFVMEGGGGTSRASSTSGCAAGQRSITLWSRRNRDVNGRIGTRQGRIGVEIGGASPFESQILERIFFEWTLR